ncbi:hypothetical protein [Micromonospora tarensis]|uniref:hypothetical protein n=1 Tax=Micromonospora tarensis TaxID=2806100 RepID=UPI001EE4043A|nr:hypothetical protein [Micromonospora tarensis]
MAEDAGGVEEGADQPRADQYGADGPGEAEGGDDAESAAQQAVEAGLVAGGGGGGQPGQQGRLHRAEDEKRDADQHERGEQGAGGGGLGGSEQLQVDHADVDHDLGEQAGGGEQAEAAQQGGPGHRWAAADGAEHRRQGEQDADQRGGDEHQAVPDGRGHPGQPEQGDHDDAQSAVDAELGAVPGEQLQAGEDAAGGVGDGHRGERADQHGDHGGVAVEEVVGERPSADGDGQHQHGEHHGGDGDAAGEHRPGGQPLAVPGGDDPGHLLLDGHEHADAEGEDDRPEHRQGRVVGFGEAVAGDGEVDIGGEAE